MKLQERWAKTLINALERLSSDFFNKNKVCFNPNYAYIELYAHLEPIKKAINPASIDFLTNRVILILKKNPELFIVVSSLTLYETAVVCVFFLIYSFLKPRISFSDKELVALLDFKLIADGREFVDSFYNSTKLLYSLERDSRDSLDVKNSQLKLLYSLVEEGIASFVTFERSTVFRFKINIKLVRSLELSSFFLYQHPFRNLGRNQFAANSIISVHCKIKSEVNLGPCALLSLEALNNKQVSVCPAFSLGLRLLDDRFLYLVVDTVTARFFLDLDDSEFINSVNRGGLRSASKKALFKKAYKKARHVLSNIKFLKTHKVEQLDALKNQALLLRGAFVGTETTEGFNYDLKTQACWEAWHINMFELAKAELQLELLSCEINELKRQQKTTVALFKREMHTFTFLYFLPSVQVRHFFPHYLNSKNYICSYSPLHPQYNGLARVALIPLESKSAGWDKLKQTHYFRVVLDLKINLVRFVHHDCLKTELDYFLAVQIFLEMGKLSKDFSHDVSCGISLQMFVDAGIEAYNDNKFSNAFFTAGDDIADQAGFLKLFMVIERFLNLGIWSEFSVSRTSTGLVFQYWAYLAQPKSRHFLLRFNLLGNRWYDIYTVVVNLYWAERGEFLAKFDNNLVKLALDRNFFNEINLVANYGFMRQYEFTYFVERLEEFYLVGVFDGISMGDLARVYFDFIDFLDDSLFLALYKRSKQSLLSESFSNINMSDYFGREPEQLCVRFLDGEVKLSYERRTPGTDLEKATLQNLYTNIIQILNTELICRNASSVNCLVLNNGFLVNIKGVGSLMDETNRFFNQKLHLNLPDYALFCLL